MPRGDGTGPFGNGPLNNGSGRSGRGSGSGRRRSLNDNGNCLRDSSSQNRLLNNQTGFRAGGLLQGTILKVLGMAVMAIPALLKARKQLSAPEERPRIETEWEKDRNVIEIKPVEIEEVKRSD
jgi:hypothetical protein